MWRYELLARLKYLLSFLNREWTLADYPVWVRRQPAHASPAGPDRVLPWLAQIVHWPQMVGLGETRAQALDSLRERLEEHKRRNGAAPRPGVPVPLVFAPALQIDRYAAVARDFMDRILGLNFDHCFISDESSLWDFPDTDDQPRVLADIHAAYRVDVSDIEDGNLVRIFERLHAAGHRGREAGHGE